MGVGVGVGQGQGAAGMVAYYLVVSVDDQSAPNLAQHFRIEYSIVSRSLDYDAINV